MNTLLHGQSALKELQESANTLDGLALDIQGTDELLNKGFVSTYLGNKSLQVDIFSHLPLFGPQGFFMNVKRKDNSKGFEFVRRNQNTLESEPEKTGITKEALEDMIQIFGKETQSKVLSALFDGIVTDKINKEVQDFLDQNACTVQNISVQDSEKLVYNVVKRQGELIHKSNESIRQGHKYFILVPSQHLSQFEILGLFGKVEVPEEDTNVIWETSKIKIVHNPNPDIQDIYVGILNQEELNRSQCAYSPYKSEIRTQISDVSGDINYHIFNRFQLTMNPVQDKSDVTKAMLWKFGIDE